MEDFKWKALRTENRLNSSLVIEATPDCLRIRRVVLPSRSISKFRRWCPPEQAYGIHSSGNCCRDLDTSGLGAKSIHHDLHSILDAVFAGCLFRAFKLLGNGRCFVPAQHSSVDTGGGFGICLEARTGWRGDFWLSRRGTFLFVDVEAFATMDDIPCEGGNVCERDHATDHRRRIIPLQLVKKKTVG